MVTKKALPRRSLYKKAPLAGLPGLSPSPAKKAAIKPAKKAVIATSPKKKLVAKKRGAR